MSRSARADDWFDRLVDGRPPGSPDAKRLAAFVADVRHAFPERPIGAEAAHLSAIQESARGLAGAPTRLHRLRAPRRARVFRSLTAKVLAGAVLVMSTFGGLAVAGALPRPVQDRVANAVSAVGIDLPGGDEERSGGVPSSRMESSEPTPSEAPTPTVSPDATTSEGDAGDQQGSGSTNDQGDQQESGSSGTDGGDGSGDVGSGGDSSGSDTQSGSGSTTDGGGGSDGQDSSSDGGSTTSDGSSSSGD